MLKKDNTVGASLEGANLQRANLSGAINLPLSQDGAKDIIVITHNDKTRDGICVCRIHK
ncbi:MAG: hypothetical protein DLM72_05545 [Candidatus Nitrosopolaris wilkensis]|nr:MAG: hypothetical protein DLM72_05545 [Candidatus Nitrosopolaris wilkensis]